MMSPRGISTPGRCSPSGRRSRTSPGCRSTSIESSRTSRSADRSPPPTPPSSSCRRRPTRSARTTTGWATSATSSRSAPSCRCPFAGYWLAKEIYAYSQTLGLTMMGGAFSWLFIIQAVLIGNLFLAANYYLWLGMGRVEGAQPMQKVVGTCSSRSRSASWSGRRRDRSSRPSPSSARSAVRHTRCSASSASCPQEHRREHPDPHDLHELPPLPRTGKTATVP